MKLTSLLLLIALSSSGLYVNANEDCEAVCADRVNDITRERDEIQRHRDEVVKEKDEIWHHRESVIKEKDELWHQRENLDRELQEVKGQMETVQNQKEKEANETANKHSADVKHFQNIAQENQKYMQEYKTQLASQRDASMKLQTQLDQTTARLSDLDGQSAISVLKKDIGNRVKSISKYWSNMKNNKSTEDL